MKHRIIQIVVVLCVIGLIYYAYVRWKQARAESGGDVQLIQDNSGDSSFKPADKSASDNLHTAPPTTPAPAATTTVTTQTSTSETPATTTTTQTVPTTDSIPANPPNGAVFSGTGRYQLYRQGSITWRLDSQTGHTCIIFATDEEWRKPRVYRSGCGRE